MKVWEKMTEIVGIWGLMLKASTLEIHWNIPG